MEELKPCPFCGGEDVRVSNWGMWRCWCDSCLAKTSDELWEKDAIEKWNRRADNA